MAMDATLMASQIIAAVSAVNPSFGGPEQGEVSDELQAFCQAIIDHVIANAETLTVVTGGSSAGAYTGTVTG